MVADLLVPILELIAQYGLLALFIFLVLDAAMLLPLVPGELLLILAIQRYATSFVGLVFVVVFATVAATLGSLLLYGIARGGGRRFIMAHPRLFFMSPRTRDKLERLFQRPAGQSLVFFLRVVPLLRLLVNLPAGLARMPVLRFTVLTVLGNLLFNAGFLWLAYETRRPDSAVANTAASLKEAYANPAWAYVQTNWALTGAAALSFGLLLSLRTAVRNARHRHEPAEGSTLGALANATLFWGGLALLAGLWIDPLFVYDLIALSGYDLRFFELGWPYEPLSIAAAIGGAAMLLALLVSSIGRAARRRHPQPTSLRDEIERRR